MKTITKKAYGKNIKITDARDNFDLAINNIYGNTEQDTTSGKNLLDCSELTTQTNNGGTITPIYDDKGLLDYINVNGTFTAWTYFDTPLSEMGQGSYIANGYCSTTPISGVSMQFFKNSTSNQIGNDTGSGLSFTLEENANVFARIVINSGVTANNLKFYPMIRLASITDGTYEPFTNGASPNPEYPQEIKSVVLSEIKTISLDGTLESVATLSEPITMNGLNGVRDTLDSKKFKTVVFDGSESGWSSSGNVSGRFLISIPYVKLNTLNAMCTQATVRAYSTSFVKNTFFISGAGSFGIDTEFATLDEWKAHLASKPMELTYELAEPIETPLPEADVEALKSLKTYDGVTHIFTDSVEVEPTLEVEYTLLQAKEDWNYTDYILHTDYNRIVGNISYLKAYLDSLFLGLTNISAMEEKTAKSLIYAREINAIETALETLNLETYKFDIGDTKEYLPNTRTLNFEDLNRIESAIFMLAEQMTSHKENLTRLAFTLGNQKGIRV